MTHCVYGVWDGVVCDARHVSGKQEVPGLAGLEGIASNTRTGTPACAAAQAASISQVASGAAPTCEHYAHQAASLLDIELETGRTHQIRVHFAALHHPCCGDLTYGADPTLAKKLGLERQWLHARSLAFAHPADGRRVEFTSPYPDDLAHALALVGE